MKKIMTFIAVIFVLCLSFYAQAESLESELKQAISDTKLQKTLGYKKPLDLKEWLQSCSFHPGNLLVIQCRKFAGCGPDACREKWLDVQFARINKHWHLKHLSDYSQDQGRCGYCVLME